MSLKLTRSRTVTSRFGTISHIVVAVVTSVIVVRVHVIISAAMITVVIRDVAITTTISVAVARHPEALISWIRIDLHFLDVYFFTINRLLRRLQQLVYDFFRIKRDKAKALTLILNFVKRRLQLDNGAILAEVIFNIVVGNVRGETTYEDFTMLRFFTNSLRVYLYKQ